MFVPMIPRITSYNVCYTKLLRYFRFAFKTLPAGGNGMAAMMGMGGGPAEPKGTDVAELVLHTVPLINRFEEKAA